MVDFFNEPLASFRPLEGHDGVTSHDLMPLWARATSEMKYPDFDSDPATIKLFNDLDLHRFDSVYSDVKDCVGLHIRNRGLHFDREFMLFAQSYPNAKVVVVGGGLTTIHLRVPNLGASWHYVDIPKLNAIRRQYIPDNGFVLDTRSYVDFDWINKLPINAGENIIFFFPNTISYFEPLDVATMMAALADKWPGVHVCFDALTSKAYSELEVFLDGEAFDYSKNLYTIEDIDAEVATWTDEELKFNVLRSYSMYDTISINPKWDDVTRKIFTRAQIMRFYNLHHVYHAYNDIF